MRRAGAFAAIVVAASFAAYFPVLTPDTQFLWDDDQELWAARGHLVQDADGIRQAWFPIQRPAAGWHHVSEWKPIPGHGFWPLTPSVFWVEWRIFGAAERWAAASGDDAKIDAVQAIANRFHVPNVLLHALNALLVWWVLARLRVPAAKWVGLFFALHPMQVPSVAWVSELKNTLSLFLLLVSLALHLRDDESPRASLHAGSLAAFFLALCAKTAGVGFPVVLLGCAAWRRGAIGRRDALRVAPFFAVALGMGLVTLWFTSHSGGFGPLSPAPAGFWERLATAGWIPLFYIWKTLWPFDLMMIYPRLEVPWRNPLAYLPWLLLPALLWLAWRRRAGWGPAVGIALVAYGALLFPVLGFFEMTYRLHAEVSDHLHYFASVPLLALVVAGSAELAARRGAPRPALRACAWLCALGLGLLTCQRAALFKSHESLWADNVARNPTAWMAHQNLGTALGLHATALAPGEERDRLARRAVEHLLASLEHKHVHLTEDVEAEQRLRLELSAILVRLGEDRAARDELERSLAAHPSDRRARIALAMLLATASDSSVRDAAAALEHAQRASLEPSADPKRRLRELHALAAAHAERASQSRATAQSDFEHAAALMAQAEDIARSAGLERQQRLAAERRALYASGRPLRREPAAYPAPARDAP